MDKDKEPTDLPNEGNAAVFDFGRAGISASDGRDQTKAIQNLIDLAGEVHGTVQVLPGVYRCGTLRMRPRMALTGHPNYSWRGAHGSVLQLNDPEAHALLDFSRAIGARLDGVCLDGGGLGEGVHGCFLDHESGESPEEDNILIERSKVTRFSGDGVHFNRIWCFRIRNGMFSENKGDGLCIRGADGFVMDNWLSLNDGAGYRAPGPGGNSALTITANRIEWNLNGGIILTNGSHFNITGNYIDRCSPGMVLERTADREPKPSAIVGNPGYTSVTGNIFYRSGKRRPGEQPIREDAETHLVLDGARGVTVTGNTFVAGCADANPDSTGHSAEPMWSPQCALRIHRLNNCLIKNNSMDNAALEELVRDLGAHEGEVLIGDNPGQCFRLG